MSLERRYQLQPDLSIAYQDIDDQDDEDDLAERFAAESPPGLQGASRMASSSYLLKANIGDVAGAGGGGGAEVGAGAGIGIGLAVSLSRCAVCQDSASGVHYGVPACEGCKGFFRRIVSSRNIGGACTHTVPLEMTPQTRNTCQWCRLKKCCAVNMGRQRSKLGRRAKLRAGAVPGGATGPSGVRFPGPALPEEQILLPGCQKESASAAGAPDIVMIDSDDNNGTAADITDQHLLAYIEQKRREFESQVCRRSCFRKEVLPAQQLQQQQQQQQQQFLLPQPPPPQPPPPPTPIPLGIDVPDWWLAETALTSA